MDAGVFKLLRGARRRGEPFHLVALSLGGFPNRPKGSGLPCSCGPFQAYHLVPAIEDLLHRLTLAVR